MEHLVLEKSSDTLGINFNHETGELDICGSSYPENTSEFFEPVIDWISNYMLEITGPITVNFCLDYLNSSSVKFVSDIVDRLANYFMSGGVVTVNWYFQSDDEDIEEMGEDLKVETQMPFNVIPI